MAEKILYGHSSSSESVGYGVIARSIASKPSSTLSIDALMQRLRIRPADLKEQYGWIWLPFDHNRRVLSRMQSITNDVGAKTLEIRMIIFSLDECESFDWQPFYFTEELHGNINWEIDSAGKLPALSFPTFDADTKPVIGSCGSFDIDWSRNCESAEKILNAFVGNCDKETRRSIQFKAPDTADRDNVRLSFQIAFEKAVVNRKASETTFPLNQKNNVVRLVLYGCVVAATLLLGVSVSYYLQRANKTNPQNKPGGVESNFIPLRPSINLDDQNQIGSERPAKENVALLKELFTTLYRRGSLLSAWNEQNDDLMHYLENRGKSENYEALLKAGLEEWIKIEINRNTIGNQIDEIQAVLRDLKLSIGRLEQLETREKLNDGLVSELAEIRRLLEEINKEVESNQTNPLDSSDGEANIGETPTD